jgi:allophanate hydrolase subunit 1
LRAQIEAYRAKFEKSERKVALLTKTINGAQTEVNANFEAMKKAFQQNSQARIAKVQATYEATITKLQEEAVTRQRELETLNRLRNEQKDASKREERLISSAFYSVGMYANPCFCSFRITEFEF